MAARASTRRTGRPRHLLERASGRKGRRADDRASNPKLFCLSSEAHPNGIPAVDEGRSPQFGGWWSVSRRLLDREPNPGRSSFRGLSEPGAGKPDYRRVGGDVAPDGNLPLRVVAAAPALASL